MTTDFDFQRWLERQIGKSRQEIIREAVHADARAHRVARKRKARLQEQAADFEIRAGRLLFWLRHDSRPDGVSDSDWALYARVYQSFVEQDENKPKDQE